MKLRFRWGMLLLVLAWLAYPYLPDERLRQVLLVASMGIALWTAFSLKIPPRPLPRDELRIVEDEEEPDDDESREKR